VSHRWSVAVAMAAWEKVVSAWDRALEQGENVPLDTVRAVFQATALVFKAYHHPENWRDGIPKEHLPRQLAYVIARHADSIAAGKLPQPIADCIAAQRPRVGPQELDDICRAVLYVAAVKNGLIQNHAPISTVAKEFGVNRRTVMGWNSKYKDLNLAEALRYIPQGETPSQHLTDQMKTAGKRYRDAGRSSIAIRSRSSKR
jgi:hypothetical protein